MNSSSSTEDKGADADADASNSLVPQLSEYKVTEGDLNHAIRVLDAISSLDPRKRKKRGPNKRKRKAAPEEKKDDGGGGGEDGDDSERPDPTEGEEDEEEDGLAQYRRPNLRRFRKALSNCLALHQQLMYDGKSESQFYEERMAERTIKRQKMAERAQQKKYVATTDLRRGRVEKLERLREDGRGEEEAKLMRLLVPDGHVDTGGGAKMLEDGNGGDADADADGAKITGDDGASPDDPADARNDDRSGEAATVLPKLRSCYACKVRFRILHHFYDQLCPACASLNYAKRHQTADATGTVAVVTGSRVKIGYQVCLKLLRAGATVVATTRFPNSAVAAYRREADFGAWKDRLRVYGLDLRDLTGLEAFARYLKGSFGERGVDVLINNACQTVRRPGGYYVPLVDRERELWKGGDEAHREVLGGCVEFERIRRRLVKEHSGNRGVDSGNKNDLLPSSDEGPLGRGKLLMESDETRHASNEKESHEIVRKQSPPSDCDVPFESTGISHSAAMSQMAIVPEDVGVDEKVLPPGLSDINGHQLDLRTSNSWLLKMDQVSTPEIMECMFVNAIAPFVLNSRLKPLMESPRDDPTRPDRYIINVSAMEGKFYRYKMPNHPHTNMAKAALNMLTRTSSEDLAKKSRIYMNSVDTGWINDENPLEKASKIAKTNLFQTPIDEIDAAARILDPVFVGVNLDKGAKGGCERTTKDYGKFFKDYKETEW
ncbi:hypothetical protein ACHAWF_012788 [Thalassiosira exigua]